MADPVLSRPEALPSTQNYFCDMCGARLKDFDLKKRMRCIACAGQVDCWYTATSWSELLQYNREFVRNQRQSTTYAMYPVFDNGGLTAELLRLHEYGCLIIDARSGGHYVEQDAPNAEPPGEWYEIKDRAYIRFLLPTDHPRIHLPNIRMLMMRLSAIAAIEMVWYYEYAEYEPGVIIPNTNNVRTARPILTEEDKEEAKTKSPSYKHFLSTVGPETPKTAGGATSKHRIAYRKEDLMWKKWKKCDHNRLPVITEVDIPRSSQGKRGFGVELPVSKAVKPVIVTMAFKQWPSEPEGGNLAEVLESAMVAVGLEPLFKEEEELRSEEAKGWHKVTSSEQSLEAAITERLHALTMGGTN